MLGRSAKVWILLIVLSLFLLVSGYVLGDRQGLLIAVLFTLGFNFLAFHFSDTYWIDYFQGESLEGHDAWGVLETLRELCFRAKMSVPSAYLISTRFPMAFSTARSPTRGRIALSRGLLDSLTAEELRAVLALELGKIKNLSALKSGVLSGLTAPLFVVAKLIDKTISFFTFGSVNKSKWFTRSLILVVGVLSRAVMSPKNFYDADHLALNWTRDPEPLAKVLLKLNNYALKKPFDLPPHAADAFTVNPLTGAQRGRYFLVQPSVSSRIEKLVGRYPV